MSRLRDHFPTLHSYFAEVRRRPGMYLGQKSILALEHQLIGISFAEDLHDIPTSARFDGFDIVAFENWVLTTFNTKRLSVRSFHLARLKTDSDAAGFDLWFEWYDRYIRASFLSTGAG